MCTVWYATHTRALAGPECMYISVFTRGSQNGAGRTGTITAAVLVRVYGLSYEEALTKTAQFHDSKRANPGVSSPQYVAQVRARFSPVAAVAPR